GGLGIEGVRGVGMHEPLTSLYAVIAIQCARGTPKSEIWRALYGAATLHRFAGKWIVAIDEDIEPENADALFWAMAYRCQPQHDLEVVPHKDPGHGPRGRATAAKAPPGRSTARSRAPTRQSRCPSASSWSRPRRSGNGSVCRRSRHSRRGTVMTSATGHGNWSAKPRWR